MSTGLQHPDYHYNLEDLYNFINFKDHNIIDKYTNQYWKIEMVRCR